MEREDRGDFVSAFVGLRAQQTLTAKLHGSAIAHNALQRVGNAGDEGVERVGRDGRIGSNTPLFSITLLYYSYDTSMVHN